MTRAFFRGYFRLPHASLAGRTAGILLLMVVGPACVPGGKVADVEGGRVALNDTLHREMEPTVGASALETFSDGYCTGISNPAQNAPCHLVSPVLGSLMRGTQSELIRKLPKAPNLWVTGGNGFASLSYEIIVEDVTLRQREDGVVLGNNVSFGSCHVFPALDPDTRQIPAAFPGRVAARNYADQVHVDVRSCTRTVPPVSTVGNLGEVKTNCDDESVMQFLRGKTPPLPQNAPMCVIDLGAGALMNDVSFALLPSQRDDASFKLEEISPGMEIRSLPLPTHLKVVPAGDIRKISRPLTYTGQVEQDGEEWIHRYQWQVPTVGQQWQENFSPNITVAAARVRRGDPTADPADYRPIDALTIAETLCKTHDDTQGYREYNIVECEPVLAPFRVTPAYTHNELEQAPGLGQSLQWEVRLRHATQTPPNDSYHLELDLTAPDGTGTSGSGLTAAPASTDLGTLRVGVAVPVVDAFEVENFGVASVRVQSIVLSGSHAAEFGQPTTSAGSAPFNLAGGDRFTIGLMPQFTSMSRKNALVEVRFVDHVGRAGMISMPIQAIAVQPAIVSMPNVVRLFALPDSTSGETSSALRAATLINAGPVPFDRLELLIDGPDAALFQVAQAEYGLNRSNLAAPLTIGPGQAEIYRIRFMPDRNGEANATLTIRTNEGDAVVGLWGVCDSGCGIRPDPNMTIELPPPEFEYRDPLFRVLER